MESDCVYNYAISRFRILLMALFVCMGTHIYAASLSEVLEARGFVAVNRMDTTIKVRLMYAAPDNFTEVTLYDDIRDAYLHPDAAKALLKAQEELHKLFPSYNLLVKDAARPMSVQRRMFSAVQGTPKTNYVANPSKGGGLHNYGLAVDITIVDENGNELAMGTPVDHLGTIPILDKEERILRNGVISETEHQKRLLLLRVISAVCCLPLGAEWWLFNFVLMR